MNKQQKCSESQKNRIVIHKDNLEKRIFQVELEDYIKQGWELGVTEQHRINNSKSRIGKPSKRKGIPTNKPTCTSWQKGHIPWNKGLTKNNDEHVAKSAKNMTESKIKKYGSAFHTNNMSEEHKQKISRANKNRCLINKNGKTKFINQNELDSYLKSGWKYGRDPEQLQIKLSKDYITRKKNKTFNTSNSEKLLYEQLCIENKNKTIFRNYKDKKRYPYYCDFYIVEDDLFIELNAHWTHGGKPFDENDPDCLKQLNIWKEKAKTSEFYKNAIITWTIRDVEKQKCAKEHNLNYKVIY